jgi:hypothetical protein
LSVHCVSRKWSISSKIGTRKPPEEWGEENDKHLNQKKGTKTLTDLTDYSTLESA